MQKISRIKSSGERFWAASRVIDNSFSAWSLCSFVAASSSKIASISSHVREGRRASVCGICTSFRDAIWGDDDLRGYGEWRLYGIIP